MVLLTQTSAIVTTLHTYSNHISLSTLQAHPNEPNLDPPTLNAPISHSQILQLHQTLKTHSPASYPHLPALLHGSAIYIPPPTPKPAPSSEYTALMARLRSEQEARDYARMLTPATGPANGHNPYARFVAPKSAEAWDMGPSDSMNEEHNQEDIDAQISLIVNVLVSIVACGAAFFMLLRYTRWSEGIRVLASMFGAVAVGIAEVVLYVQFVRRTDEGKRVERGRREERSVADTWVIEGRGVDEKPKTIKEKSTTLDDRLDALRRRKGKMKAQEAD